MNTFPGGSIFSPPKPSPPPPPPPLPTSASVAASASEKARKEEERLARQRRSGLKATRLTSGLGDNDTAEQRSTLGGA